MRLRVRFFTIAILFLAVTGASAQDGWVQTTTPNFTVVANGGEKRAQDIALQFERYRTAIQNGWPWARQQFDRPVVVIAAKDEATMKLLAPQYWEKGSGLQPVSVFTTGPDAYFIALRSDVRDEDNANNNPFQASYWSYTSLALSTAFEHPLPLWFRNGFAAVLSNSIVRSDHIDFGRPPDAILRVLQTNIRLTMPEFLALDARSRYYTDSQTRPNFDAQSWSVMHYLLFGLAQKRPDAVNQLAKLLMEGKSSADAVREVFGSVDALDSEFVLYRQQQVYQYLRVAAPNNVSAATFTNRVLDSQQALAMRARFHLAMGRTSDARGLAETLKARTPVPAVAFDIDGVLLDRAGQRDDARAAYAKAADANTDSFFSLYRLATLDMQANVDAERLARVEALLRRAIASNTAFAPAHTLLANVLISQNKAAEAVEIARHGAVVSPGDAFARLAFARALWGASRKDEARGQALAARSLADSDQERAAVQATVDFFNRRVAPSPAPAAAGTQNRTASQSAGGIGTGIGSGTGTGIVGGIGGGAYRPGNGVTLPRVLQEVKPAYTREALANRVEGTVWLQAVVLPDGSVGNVQVTKSLDRVYGLDDEAIKAARRWRFEPGTRNGSPVPVLVTIELSFTVRPTEAPSAP